MLMLQKKKSKMDKLKVYKNNIKKNNKGNVYKYIEISKSFKKFQKSIFQR